MKNTSNKGVAYIIPSNLGDSAISENVRRRKKILESLGFNVHLIESHDKQAIKVCLVLWKLRLAFRYIIIRLDGTGILDKYTLLKLALPRHIFIWEIHGFPEERLEFSKNLRAQWFVWKNSIKRRILSVMANACIFISSDLQAFSKHKIFIRYGTVIPNFIRPDDITYQLRHRFLLPSLLRKKAFVVLWGGDASLPWQATDLIQKVANEIEKYDENIIFFLVGINYYYSTIFSKNIVYLKPMPYSQFISLVNRSDTCLALYHKPKHFPFYFYPMKLIDYLSAGKPVIATKLGIINTIIEHEIRGFVTNNSISNVVRIILRLKQDRNLAKKIADNARAYAHKNFNVVSARSGYKTLFQSLVS